MTVYYEWDIETVDANGDVQDHNHSASFPGHPKALNERLVLVRNKCTDGDLDHRSWSYVDGGKLPELFDDGSRVPKRFHAEVGGQP